MGHLEKRQVLSRLAGREAASLVGAGIQETAGDDRKKAIFRLMDDLGVQAPTAKFALARLVKHLQDSDLTINFKAFKFFNSKPQGTGYVSTFEGGNTRHAGQSYITARDVAEEALFDYSGAKARAAHIPMAVINRVRHFGRVAEPTFEPSMRPKYAALNYARLPNGSAGQYGKSFMVLKEHVKHNATYVHTDSFDESGNARQRAALAAKVATFIAMDRLIVNMPPAMLTALDKASQGHSFGNVTQVPGLGNQAYVEAHVHGEVRFDRDIAKIVISASEVANAETEIKKLIANGLPFKVRSPQQLRAVFETFARKHGIPVVYV
jgi:hypothetical protein